MEEAQEKELKEEAKEEEREEDEGNQVFWKHFHRPIQCKLRVLVLTSFLGGEQAR